MVTQFTELTDSQWEVMKVVLNCKRKRKHDLRAISNAMLFVARTGLQWRNLPKEYPKWTIVYYYFRRWTRDGTIDMLNLYLGQMERYLSDKEADPSLVCVDSQSIKSVPFVSRHRGLDPFKKVNGRKRHVVVDTLGLVIGVVVRAANSSDAVEGCTVLERCRRRWARLRKVLVDGAYQGRFLRWVEQHTEAVVEHASRPETVQGFVPIRWRWVVERTFAWFNFFRRLDKDREKTVESSESWILLANCSVILNRLENWPN
ncbi:MAG: IS5 family transposase [Saprospiraceae bacterium]